MRNANMKVMQRKASHAKRIGSISVPRCQFPTPTPIMPLNPSFISAFFVLCLAHSSPTAHYYLFDITFLSTPNHYVCQSPISSHNHTSTTTASCRTSRATPKAEITPWTSSLLNYNNSLLTHSLLICWLWVLRRGLGACTVRLLVERLAVVSGFIDIRGRGVGWWGSFLIFRHVECSWGLEMRFNDLWRNWYRARIETWYGGSELNVESWRTEDASLLLAVDRNVIIVGSLLVCIGRCKATNI